MRSISKNLAHSELKRNPAASSLIATSTLAIISLLFLTGQSAAKESASQSSDKEAGSKKSEKASEKSESKSDRKASKKKSKESEKPAESASEKTETRSTEAKPVEPSLTTDNAQISAEKREAIKELLRTTEMTKTADEIYKLLLSSGQKSFTLNLEQSIKDDPRLGEAQRTDLLQKAKESSDRMFARYRELLPQRLNLSEILEQVSFKVYDKYFTTQELNDIIGFYRTPAGKKALSVLPQVMEESTSMTGRLITPKVKDIVAEIVIEERRRIESQAAAEAAEQKSATGEKPASTEKEKSSEKPTSPEKKPTSSEKPSTTR